MRLRIDTVGMTFMAAGPPEPVVDFDTKQPRTDTETGQALFAVQVVVLADGGADVIGVKVAGEPKGIAQGSPIKVTGLVASPWSMGDRSGVAFRAAAIEPAAATTARAAA
jgi:hypothetical protein